MHPGPTRREAQTRPAPPAPPPETPHRGLPTLVGQRIAERYHLDALIGSGGFGAVYRAQHLELGTRVAVKVVTHARPDMLLRFRREAQAQDRLQSRYIVRIKDYGCTDDGLHFMVQSFVPGRTLKETVTDDGPLDPIRAARLTRQIALALAEAHDLGVLHRDIKPGNVMLTDYRGEEEVRLLDFGLARVRDSDRDALTLTGQVFGTVAYIAPERLRGEEAGPAADIYSTGVLLYVLLAGHAPYEGDLRTVAAQHMGGPLPPMPPGVPPALGQVVHRAMAKKPEDRYPGADAMARALRAVIAAHGEISGPLDEPDVQGETLLFDRSDDISEAVLTSARSTAETLSPGRAPRPRDTTDRAGPVPPDPPTPPDDPDATWVESDVPYGMRLDGYAPFGAPQTDRITVEAPWALVETPPPARPWRRVIGWTLAALAALALIAAAWWALSGDDEAPGEPPGRITIGAAPP